MKVMGEDRRFTLRWANRSHNALGNFLHAPTLHQLETGNVPDHGTMREKAEEIAAAIEHTLATPIFTLILAIFFTYRAFVEETSSAGRAASPRRPASCARMLNCRTIWDVVSEEGGKVELRPRQTEYVCPGCKETRDLMSQKIKAGEVIVL
jgi:hypothetical protein